MRATICSEAVSLFELAKSVGIEYFATADYAAAAPHLVKPHTFDFTPQSVLFAAFPYYIKDEAGNIARYARSRDYHRLVTERLTAFCEALGGAYEVFSDISPFDEVSAAAACGLGSIGKNRLLIVDGKGSFFVIGECVTETYLTPMPRSDCSFCSACGRCEKACPTAALQGGICQKELCLSDLTQRRGALTDAETQAVAKSALVWGCDECLAACPLAKDAPPPDAAFAKDRITTLTPEELLPLSDRAFRQKYQDRAFTWKGVAPLKRNTEEQEKWKSNAPKN